MYRAVVSGLVKEGKIEEALDAVGDIVDPQHAAEAAFDVATHTGDPDHFADAAALATHIEDQDKRGVLEDAISLARAPQEHIDNSL